MKSRIETFWHWLTQFVILAVKRALLRSLLRTEVHSVTFNVHTVADMLEWLIYVDVVTYDLFSRVFQSRA